MKITEDQVFEVIERMGITGISRQDLAKRVGADPSYRAKQLIKAGLITRKRDGQLVRYYVKLNMPPALPSFTQPINPVNTIHKPELGAQYELKKEVVVKKSELDKLVDSFVGALATQVIERLRPMLIERLKDSVVAMTEEIVHTAPVKTKLPSILIGGLHPDQTKMIEKEFEGVADLRFVSADESNSVWKSRAANAQHTLLMVDFLSHKHIETVKATGVMPIILRGGLTKMRDKLMELSV